MATLSNEQVREQLHALDSTSAVRTPAQEQASADLASAFATFDGSDAAYVRHLTGASVEDMLRVGAI